MRLVETDITELVTKPLSTNYLFQDLTGQTFGSLSVVGYAGYVKNFSHWFVQCECGTLCEFPAPYLTRGRNTHCGCLSDNPQYGKTVKQHGMSKTATHASWRSMIERCKGYTETARKHYTGIQVCERWLTFENFLADMGERPGLKYSIDRKNSKGHYTPENCRWATATEQNRNRSNTTWLTIEGVKKPLTQWAEECGLSDKAIRQRLRKGESGKDLIRAKRASHKASCPTPLFPCNCRRSKFDVDKKILGAVQRYQERGSAVTIRRLSNRASMTQPETIERCKQLGLIVIPGERTGQTTVVDGQPHNDLTG